MSLEVWPYVPPADLKSALEATQLRELEWQLREIGEQLQTLKLGIENCHKLLAPDGRGNTLVVSTPRNEAVKGHFTRLGTQIAKGTIHLRLRTLPPQTIVISPDYPIAIDPLTDLNTLLTRSIDLLTLALSYIRPSPVVSSDVPERPSLQGSFLAAQLRVLAQALRDASALLKGGTLGSVDTAWMTRSASPGHFTPALPPSISFYMGLQDSQLVLWLRSLELVDAPVNLGMKFALALGTARRLEHDEADQVFTFCCEDGLVKGLHTAGSDEGRSKTADSGGPAEVYVREKLRVESADPNLLSLSAKLHALGNALLSVRTNLAAVLREELED